MSWSEKRAFSIQVKQIKSALKPLLFWVNRDMANFISSDTHLQHSVALVSLQVTALVSEVSKLQISFVSRHWWGICFKTHLFRLRGQLLSQELSIKGCVIVTGSEQCNMLLHAFRLSSCHSLCLSGIYWLKILLLVRGSGLHCQFLGFELQIALLWEGGPWDASRSMPILCGIATSSGRVTSRHTEDCAPFGAVFTLNYIKTKNVRLLSNMHDLSCLSQAPFLP